MGIFFLCLFTLPKRSQNRFRSLLSSPVAAISSKVFKKPKKSSRPSKTFTPTAQKLEPSFEGEIAQVIFRSPKTWNDSFWINMGKKDNAKEKKIALNSPVLFDGQLVGLVDYVGQRQSRVQLITNQNSGISVRAYRGSSQYQDIYASIEKIEALPFVDPDSALFQELDLLKNHLRVIGEEAYLAKGELYGTQELHARSKNFLLKGEGFQCQFSDAKSPKRDLLSGKVSESKMEPALPLLQEGDLLITTGFDGVLPEGIEVARVLKVMPLQEGASSYDLSALPLSPKIKDLSYVEVILPTEYEALNVGLPAFEK